MPLTLRWIPLFIVLLMHADETAGATSSSDTHRYQAAGRACLDNLLAHGTDRYGPAHTPMLMNIMDVRMNESPTYPDPRICTLYPITRPTPPDSRRPS